ncbi:MAG: rod shape-determining protein MreC [Actinobacteria bacterium]|nr:rod shape-determining protein MreC [Actinomycetota bacterium]
MRSNRPRFVFLVTVATAVSLLTLDFRGFGPMRSVQSGLRVVTEPVADGVYWVFSPVRNAWNGVWDHGDLAEENASLRQRIAELEENPAIERRASEQLEILQGQLGLEAAATTERVIARVVSGPVSNLESTIRIDRGSNHGIRRNMTVVTEQGLIGRVAEVTPTRSVIELVDSSRFGVTVRLAEEPASPTFVLVGQGRGRPLRVQGEVPVGTFVNGAALVTSGIEASLYPPDLPVGAVVGVTETPPPVGVVAAQTVDGVEVALFADLASLSYVTVLLWEPEP